jgi:predicted nuclease of predicted toxin-antitoxin system
VRVLLEESLPRTLARQFSDLILETVLDRGWAGLKNGELLARAAADFDVFLTADQNLKYQQNLKGFDIGVVVMAAKSNRVADLLPLVAEAQLQCQKVKSGEVRVVTAETPGGAT